MPREFSEEERELITKLADDLAAKTRESILDPTNEALSEEIKEIRRRIHEEFGLEICCARRLSINENNPEDINLEVEVTLHFPPPIN